MPARACLELGVLKLSLCMHGPWLFTDAAMGTGAVQNAVVFQAFGIASRHLMYESGGTSSPLTYPQTFLSGTGRRRCRHEHIIIAPQFSSAAGVG